MSFLKQVKNIVGRRVARKGRWVVKLVASLFATAALWGKIQTSLKNKKMGDISKGVVNTARQKI